MIATMILESLSSKHPFHPMIQLCSRLWGSLQLEFNILEAYVSRLLGEFSKQEPSIEVSAENPENADPQTIEVVEQHMRHCAILTLRIIIPNMKCIKIY